MSRNPLSHFPFHCGVLRIVCEVVPLPAIIVALAVTGIVAVLAAETSRSMPTLAEPLSIVNKSAASSASAPMRKQSIAANALRIPHFPRFAIAFSGLLDCSSQAANPPASRYFHS